MSEGSMSSAVVVGGAGFVGSHLVERLLADGVVVDVVDDLSTGSLANLADARGMGGQLKIHHLDAAAPECDSLIGMRRPDVIYHLAAVPGGTPAPAELAGAFAATLAVANAARHHRIRKIVVALPAGVVYGRPTSKDLPVKEGELTPRGPRGVVARAAVDLLEVGRDADAVEFSALALGTVYGHRQRPGAGVVAALVEAARERAVPQIRGDGRQTRDFVYVDDVVDAFACAGVRGSGLVINIGTGRQTSINDLWAAVAGPGATAPEYVPPHAGDVPRFALSPVRARIHLGWSAWTELEEGLAQLR